MKQTFRIVTLGCKSNQADSAVMASKLISGGYCPAESDRIADVCVVNTCTVTNKSDAQSRQAIRKIIRENPTAKIIVTGCYANAIRKEDFSAEDKITIIPVEQIDNFTHYIPWPSRSFRDEGNSFMGSEGNEPKKPKAVYTYRRRAFYKIQDGCDNRCAYCAVWKARGASRSKTESEIIQDIKTIERSGFKEVVLSGIHIGAWGKDLAVPSSLTNLIEKILQATDFLRIRISSIEVNEIGIRLVEMMRSNNRICRHLHIPLQSGSDSVLVSMRRNYSSEFYFRRIQEIADSIPLCCIGADVIAGFPGETDEDHRHTMEMIKKSPLSYLHVFPFSAKRNTEAYNMKNKVGSRLRLIRTKDLRKLSKEKYCDFINMNIGDIVNVLPDGNSLNGSTINVISDNYIRFSLANEAVNFDDTRGIVFSEENARTAIERIKDD